MKVNQYSSITQIFNRVTDKNQDKQGGAGSNAFERHKKDEKNENEFEATVEEVQAAIDQFGHEDLTQGITAEAAGTGPGLKVVLKDAAGGVLRAVSGEEFLKLREAAAHGKKSGRILDQKA